MADIAKLFGDLCPADQIALYAGYPILRSVNVLSTP